MKKLVLLCSFGLLGSFALASGEVLTAPSIENAIVLDVKNSEDEKPLICDWCIESAWGQSYCATAATCPEAKKKALSMMMADLEP